MLDSLILVCAQVISFSPKFSTFQVHDDADYFREIDESTSESVHIISRNNVIVVSYSTILTYAWERGTFQVSYSEVDD